MEPVGLDFLQRTKHLRMRLRNGSVHLSISHRIQSVQADLKRLDRCLRPQAFQQIRGQEGSVGGHPRRDIQISHPLQQQQEIRSEKRLSTGDNNAAHTRFGSLLQHRESLRRGEFGGPLLPGCAKANAAAMVAGRRHIPEEVAQRRRRHPVPGADMTLLQFEFDIQHRTYPPPPGAVPSQGTPHWQSAHPRENPGRRRPEVERVAGIRCSSRSYTSSEASRIRCRI